MRHTTGTVYVYVKGTSGWPTVPTATLNNPSPSSTSAFGLSVAIAKDTAIVTGDDNVYVYTRGSSGWPATPSTTLADPAAPQAGFGWAIALSSSGGTAVVSYGAAPEDAYAAYVFVRGPSGWPATPTATFHDPGANENRFGFAVGTSDSVIAVSAIQSGRPPLAQDEGSVYIYEKGTAGWPTTPTLRIKDPNSEQYDAFGTSVAMSGRELLVGLDGEGNGFHAAYIYERDGSSWPKTPSYKVSDPRGASYHDGFAFSVSMSSTTAVIGSPPDGRFMSGAAYIYEA